MRKLGFYHCRMITLTTAIDIQVIDIQKDIVARLKTWRA